MDDLAASTSNSATSSDGTAGSEHFGSDFGEDGDQLLADLIDKFDASHKAASSGCEGANHNDGAPKGSLKAADPVLIDEDAANLHPIPSIEVPIDAGNGSSTSNLRVTDSGRRSSSVVKDASPGRITWDPSLPGPDEQTKSPLERFRTRPRKPMSVTDLISPAWCEIQYMFSLSRFGRIRQTPAMQRGSSVHKELEEQVYQTVPVDVTTKEDHWGLKIWNVIQGLRILRVTGMTRELEIWGIIDGQVVSGIIDEISFTCTDPELEEVVKRQDSKKEPWKELPSSQTTISEFFAAQKVARQKNVAKGDQHKIYLTDVKTRNSPRLPDTVSMRPTRMQLMLYRKLLGDLVSNNIEADRIFERYQVDPTAKFSDTLIRQLGQLELNLSPNATQETEAPVESATDVVVELIIHNDLEKLWMLMMTEMQKTFAMGQETISKVLHVEYRASKSGELVGSKSFIYDDEEVNAYISNKMEMWRGKRAPAGVDIEEAFKCRICEFADDCGWRRNKVDDVVAKSRARRASSKSAEQQG